MYFLSIRSSDNVENFYYNGTVMKGCFVHIRVAARGEGSIITVNECWWEHERGRKNARGTAQLSQVPQVLFAFLFVKVCIVKNLGVR